ncbi:hypothetical protein ACFQPA_03310 [Halomarina halobia]|uniref:DUF4239 domain-containing protein n=1 Tax=Halomarina halobia TaxID=3033386 RepID=A0ABD6A4Z1_9EURY|nr:hypothetical protein [Halomarina sp. PSR21]
MDGDELTQVRPASEVGTSDDDMMGSVAEWLLIDGNRLLITVGGSVLVGGIVYALIRLGVLLVRPGTMLPTLLGSGVTSGLLTLVTVALSVNQLVLSRVFGSPSGLSDRLDATVDFRSTVEDIAGQTSSPNDPARFISLVGVTMRDRVERLSTALREPGLGEDSFDDYLGNMREYADGLVDAREKDGSTVELVSTLLGPAYADNLVATKHLRRERGDELSPEANEHLDAVFELLKAIAMMRQFFKTMAIHRDLARLSRRLIYLGLFALLVTFCLTLVYTRSSVSLPPDVLVVAVSAGLAIIVSPVALLSAYMLRVATVSLYSVSVGPFVPPDER